MLFEISAADVIQVRDAASLKAALSKLTPGSTLRIAAGEYPGGHQVRGVEKVTIEAADPEHPPHFKGGSFGWHFSNCSGLTLRHLRVSGQSRNGINLDDGGRDDRPMKNVTLEHLDIRDIGPKGNADGLKCSGLDDVTIRHCTIEGWGGQAIDFVGCHRVLVSECRFTGKPNYSQASGVQCKGGSEDVTIENCRFVNAGQRPINAGGSTGLAYFRPKGAKYEARKIVIRKNEISGSLCACAFVGVDGAEFSDNTILFPEKWIFRILQETTEPGFVPSRNVLIENNAIIFRRSQVSTEVNIGANTAPETFRFAKNRWFAEDRPDRSRPNLPTEEKAGAYGRDPRVSK
jgi:polygalacturonase